MTRTSHNQREKRSGTFCQASGCFELADFYIVLKETKEPDYYEISKESNYEKIGRWFEGGGGTEFDKFKMILYFCRMHDSEFRYHIRGCGLRIARRRDLHTLEIRQGL